MGSRYRLCADARLLALAQAGTQQPKGWENAKKKASALHASFKDTLENPGNLLLSSFLAQLCVTRLLQPHRNARSSHSRCQKMALQNAQLCAWLCQPNKAEDVSLWLLLYQLITLGKLWCELYVLRA